MSQDKSLKDKAVKIKGKDYVLVSDRVLYFNEQYPNGAIESSYSLDSETYHFKAVVTPDTDQPARKFVGHSQATIGDGMVNKTAAMENAETSAVGRALAMMGIGVIESIASADEVHKATGSTGKATDKQINMLRDTAKRITGDEDGEQLDDFIEKIVGYKPETLSSKAVWQANQKLQAYQKALQEREAKQLQEADVVVTTIPDNFNLDDVPY